MIIMYGVRAVLEATRHSYISTAVVVSAFRTLPARARGYNEAIEEINSAGYAGMRIFRRFILFIFLLTTAVVVVVRLPSPSFGPASSFSREKRDGVILVRTYTYTRAGRHRARTTLKKTIMCLPTFRARL